MARGKNNVPASDFARAVVQYGGDPQKIAERFNMEVQSVKLRYNQWKAKFAKDPRNRGKKFPLPPLKVEPRGGKRLDWDELAAIAEEYAPAEEGVDQEEGVEV